MRAASAIAMTMVIMIIGCNAAINPTPDTFALPYPGIQSIALSRNTTTVVAVTYSQAFAVYSKPNGGPMTLLSKSDYFPGDFRCVLAGQDQYQVGIVTAQQTNFSHPITSIVYRFQEPNGTFIVQSTNQFELDQSSFICAENDAERSTGSGFYMMTASSATMYWLNKWNPALETVGPLAAFAVLQAQDIVVIPGTNTTGYEPTQMLITTAYPNDQAPLYQFSLPTPHAPTRTRSLAKDEIGAQYVNLYQGYSPDKPSQGWLITTLVNSGVRLTPYDFDTFTASGAAIVDKQTTYVEFGQRLIIERLNRCVYIVGSHPASTQAQPIVTFSQWYSNTATGTPQLIDQVTLKLISKSMNGIVGMRVGWMGYTYLADDQNIYRFQTQCPNSHSD